MSRYAMRKSRLSIVGAPRRADGFGLVEMMVALAIGMIAVVVIMQVLMNSEGSKRAAVSGDDTQTSALIGLTTIQRELRQAGQDFNTGRLLGCNVTMPGGWTITSLAPATINHAAIPAGDANTDTLLIASGSAGSAPEGDPVNAQPAANQYAVGTPTRFAPNDFVMARPGGTAAPPACNLTLTRVSAVSLPPNPPLITVQTGQAGMGSGSSLFNLGPAPRITAYAVRNGVLTACDYVSNNCSLAANLGNTAIWVPISPDTVSLRAQYGVDTSPTPDQVVDDFNQDTTAAAANWTRVAAVRVALVVRTPQYEKTVVMQPAASWAGGASAPIVLNIIPDWDHYHYKTLQTTVALRNVAWLGI